LHELPERPDAVLARGLPFKVNPGNLLTSTPPQITSCEEMDKALDIISRCFGDVENR